jgi:predicted transcriptional regulator
MQSNQTTITPQTPDTEFVSTSLRLPRPLWRKLRDLAEERRSRRLNAVMVDVLQEYVDRRPASVSQ